MLKRRETVWICSKLFLLSVCFIIPHLPTTCEKVPVKHLHVYSDLFPAMEAKMQQFHLLLAVQSDISPAKRLSMATNPNPSALCVLIVLFW